MLFMLVFLILLIWLIPLKEKDYLENDLVALRRQANHITIGTISIGFAVICFMVFRRVSGLRTIAAVLIRLVFILIPLFFTLRSFILFAMLQLNTIVVNKEEKPYQLAEMESTEDKRYIFLLDLDDHKIIKPDNILNHDKLKDHKKGDTITIVFNVGTLGYKLQPRVK